MSSTAMVTVMKMMESLPEPVQDQVVDHLREYLEDLQDELQWNSLFRKTQPQLVAAARRAKQEIAEGHAQPMDYFIPLCISSVSTVRKTSGQQE